jgi:DNA-binding NtrC family response regulator
MTGTDQKVQVDNTKMAGNSNALAHVLQQARQYAGAPRPILIRGERGTGKELMARYVHTHGTAPNAPFTAVNCAIYNDELLASALFGHEKGAFTGADQMQPGCLERAQNGTLFFDEIANMSVRFQEKMLRVLETRTYERVGGQHSLKIEARFIFATNADLNTMMENDLFRHDFYDRISFVTLNMPPLRERREDIPALINFFTRSLLTEIPNLDIRHFSPEALELLQQYYWPGNIRELKNVVERLLLREGFPVIPTAELPPEITASRPAGKNFEEKIAAYKQHLILTAWRDSGFSQKAAAKYLGMSYDQFRHYFRKYNIKSLSG